MTTTLAIKKAHIPDPLDSTSKVQSVTADATGSDPIDVPTKTSSAVVFYYEFLEVPGTTTLLVYEGDTEGPTVETGDIKGPYFANGEYPDRLVDSAGPSTVKVIVQLAGEEA